MNVLRTFVCAAFLAIFTISSAVAQNYAPTLEQVGTPATFSDYILARKILGEDFISPEEVAQARNLFYSDVQLALLQGALPSREVLEWLANKGYILVAGPPTALSLLDVRRLNDALFLNMALYVKNGKVWYVVNNEAFPRTDTVGPQWLALRKYIVPNSTYKTWGEQLRLLTKDERIPNVAEVAWGFTTYKEVRGLNLLFGVYVRTSSIDSEGVRVGIGNFGPDGLEINHWPGDKSIDFGISPVRKF